MASNVTFNGSTYSIPAEGDENWGPDLTNYFISIASNAFQKTAGTFTLTAEANFGATYGLKSAYFKSQGTNPSSAGVVRLANTEGVYWRNAANGANLELVVDSSDRLVFNGGILSGNALTHSTVTAAGAYAPTAATGSRFILFDATLGNQSLTLPAITSANNGLEYHVTKIDSSGNTVTITGTVSGESNPVIDYQYTHRCAIASAGAWYWKA
jgi:hypothetical protein